jgi:chemotaxis protein histidine kinase CheA/ActR/RegA family two-component response regulator
MSPISNSVSANHQPLLEEALTKLQEIETTLYSSQTPENAFLENQFQGTMDYLQALGQSLHLPTLELFIHYLQPILQKIYGDNIALDTAFQGLLQQSLSCIEDLLQAYLQSEQVGPRLAEAQPMFDMLAARSNLTSLKELPLPSHLVSSLLETEFLPILERMATLLGEESPEPRVHHEFCTHLDVLRHLGQLLQMPKFGEIAQDTITDLRVTPEDLPRIGKVALLRLQRIYHHTLTSVSSTQSTVSEAQTIEQTNIEQSYIAAVSPPVQPTHKIQSNLPQSVVDFLAVAPSWMDLIEADLFTLKDHGSLNTINNLMRNTHTLKGAAVGAELATVRSIAHSLETFFRILCQPEVELDGHLEVLLFQAYDCLRQSILVKSMDTSITEVDLRHRASSIFEQLQERFGALTSAELSLPSSTELGVDIVHSIFEMEVDPRLQTLQTLSEQQDETSLSERLKDTAEIFLGIAEAFELEGFGAIAHTTLRALDYHPDQVDSIVQLALMDFRNGQQRILAGDRVEGGHPSAALQHLAQSPTELSPLPPQEGVPSPINDSDIQGQRDLHPQPSNNQMQPSLKIEPETLGQLQLTFQELFSNYYQQAAFHEQLHGYLDQFQSGYVQHQALLTQLYDLTQSLFLRQPASQPNLPLAAGEAEQDRLNTEHTIQSMWELSLNESLHFQSLATKLVNFHRQSSALVAQYFNLLNTARTHVLEVSGVPLSETFHRLSTWFEHLVMDYQKAADLRIVGNDLKIDPAIASPLYDVLLHLLRNAFDHGIEPPELRQQRGKPECGQITVQATQQEEQLIVEVRDDGAGLDFGRIGDRAAQLGLISMADATTASAEQLLDLIFEPGFSTVSEVTDLSGRGVGLDAVRARIQALQGSISVQSRSDEGATFILRIPQFPTVSEQQPTEASVPVAEETSPIILPTLPESLAADDEQFREPMTAEELQISLDDMFGQNFVLNEPMQPVLGSEEQLNLVNFEGERTEERTELIPAEPISESILEPVAAQHPESSRSTAASERVLDTKRLFVWQAGNIAFVLPYNCIEEHILPSAGRLIQVQQQRFLQWRNQILPIYRLSDFLLPSDYLQVVNESEAQGQTLLLVIRLGQQIFALESTVHHLITVPALVVKPLNAKGYAPLYIYGQTSLEHQSNLVLIDAETLLYQTLGIPEDKIATAGFGSLEQWNNELQAANRNNEPSEVAAKLSVLVIDDSKMVREILKTTLEGAGYDVLEAQNGQVAIDLAPQFLGIDLVICDVAMPKMNGFDFLRTCRQYPAYATVPVIMLSNCDGEVHQQLAFRLGATAYFTKPYNEQNLLSTLKELIKV